MKFDQCAILVVSSSLSLQKDDQQKLELYAARKNQGLSDQIFIRHRFKKGAAACWKLYIAAEADNRSLETYFFFKPRLTYYEMKV